MDQNNERFSVKIMCDSTSSYIGKVVLLVFSWWNCGPCQEEASHLEALYQKYKSQGFQALSLLSYNDKNQLMLPEGCLRWAQIFGQTTPVLADTFNGVYDPYFRDRTVSAPHSILIDRTGKIRAIYDGYSPAIKSKVEAKIKKLLAE